MHWDFALILIFFAVAVPWLGRRRVLRLLQSPDFSSVDRLQLYASTVAFQWVAAGLIFWRIRAHGLPLASLGAVVPKPALSITVAVVFSLALLVNQLFGLRHLSKHPGDSRSLLTRLAAKIFPRSPAERLAFFAVVLTVALCEEWIYRGFVQRVFQDTGKGAVAAGIVVSAALFGFAHLYQGRRGVISTSCLGLVFSIIRAWTGSLLPGMAAHFVADFSVGLLAPARIDAVAETVPTSVGGSAAPTEAQQQNIK